MPVAVAEGDRQVDAVLAQLGLERRDQLAVLAVDRADAAEALVVVRHLLEPLARDVAAARHVLEERHHVVHALRAAERDDEQRVVAAVVETRIGAVGRLLERVHRRHRGARVAPWTGTRLRCGAAVVAVAQLVEPRVVVPVVAGSSPVRHPRLSPAP